MKHKFILIALFLSVEVSAQTITMALGYRRALNSDFIGFNAQNTIRDSMSLTEPHLVSKFPELRPKIIRYPAGSISNWWNWKAGWFMVNDPNCPNDFKSLEVKNNGLDSLKKVCDASGAVPLFVLNLVSSNLPYQLEMLDAAYAIGLPVKYVELGNEFYLNEGSDSTIIDSIFPTGVEYGTVATVWIDSIHKHYPDCKVAAIGAFNRNNEPRRVNWDPEMYTTLKNEDAISFHAYYSANVVADLPEAEKDTFKTEMVPDFLYRPSKVWSILSDEDFSIMPKQDEIWMTEYNLQDHNLPVHGSWAHGLYLASLTSQFLNNEKITHTAIHAICGSAVYGMYFNVHNGFIFGGGEQFVNPVVPPDSTQYWGLTAAGRTIKTLSIAMEGMTYASPIEFKNVPIITTIDNKDTVSYPSAFGWLFTNDTATHVIIFNYSDTIQNFRTKFAFPNGGTYKEYYAGATQYIAFESDVRSKSKSKIPGQYKAEAYSISYLRSTSVPNPPPIVNITADGSTILCSGDSVKLSAGVAYNEYLWSTGEKTKNIWVKTEGDYILQCRSEKNGYIGIDTIHVTVNAIPDVNLTVDGEKKICEGVETTNLVAKDCSDCTFVWYKYGVIIPDSTDQIITITYAGDYSYIAINSSGCSVESNVKTISADNCKNEFESLVNENSQISIYPNPAQNTIHIKSNSKIELVFASIEVQNLLGEIIIKRELKLNGKPLDTELEILSLKSGMYVVVVKSENFNFYKPLIVSR